MIYTTRIDYNDLNSNALHFKRVGDGALPRGARRPAPELEDRRLRGEPGGAGERLCAAPGAAAVPRRGLRAAAALRGGLGDEDALPGGEVRRRDCKDDKGMYKDMKGIWYRMAYYRDMIEAV